MTALDYYKKAWSEVQPRAGAWFVFGLAYFTILLLTCGLGGVLAPNVMREVRNSRAEQRGPSVGGLLDTSNLSSDAVVAVIWLLVFAVASSLGGVGGMVVSVLFRFVMPLAADKRFAPLDIVKVSVAHVSDHASDHLVFLLVSWAVGLVGFLTCGLALPMLVAVSAMAEWLWYEDVRADLDGIAQKQGIARLTAS